MWDWATRSGRLQFSSARSTKDRSGCCTSTSIRVTRRCVASRDFRSSSGVPDCRGHRPRNLEPFMANTAASDSTEKAHEPDDATRQHVFSALGEGSMVWDDSDQPTVDDVSRDLVWRCQSE